MREFPRRVSLQQMKEIPRDREQHTGDKRQKTKRKRDNRSQKYDLVSYPRSFHFTAFALSFLFFSILFLYFIFISFFFPLPNIPFSVCSPPSVWLQEMSHLRAIQLDLNDAAYRLNTGQAGPSSLSLSPSMLHWAIRTCPTDVVRQSLY